MYSCCFTELSKSAPAQPSGKKSAVTEPLLKTAAFDNDSDSDDSDSDISSTATDDQKESREAEAVRDGGKVLFIQPDMSQQHQNGNSNKSRSNNQV